MSTYHHISDPKKWKIIERYNIDNNEQPSLINTIVFHNTSSKEKWNNWFEIKKSTIKNAGLGLFALRTFKANTIIGKYDGDILHEFPGDIQARNYTLKLGDRYINGRKGRLGYVHFANDARSDRRNQCFFTPGGYVKVREGKIIRKNKEIFIDYGQSYWT